VLDGSDVQFFLAIQRAATLAGAARALKVEHTTVGRRLAAMESALGAKLFLRTPDGFRPTRMAEEILPLAEQAEAALMQIERIALADDERAEGTVRVWVSEVDNQPYETYIVLGKSGSDLMALAALQAIRDAGLEPGRDVAVIGFDDIEAAALAHPPLTTIRQDRERLGIVAAERALELIEHADTTPPDTIIPVELVVRGSTSPD